MNDNHHLNPDELDAYLTARQQGQNPDLSVASAPQEIRLAEQIIQFAEAAQPDADFAAALEVQLTARQQRPGGRQRQPAGFSERTTTMFRRMLFPLAGAAVLLLLAVFVLPKFSAQPLEPLPALAGRETDPKSVYNAAPVAAVDRQANPESMPNAAPMAAASGQTAFDAAGGVHGLYVTGTFSGTEFILQAQLPGMAERINVYRQTAGEPMTLEAFRNLAKRFGLQGTIYTEAMQVPILYDTPEDMPDLPDLPVSYILFDGTRQLSGGDWGGVGYYDRGVALFTQPGEAPAAGQIIAAAETFLRDRSLLNFAYRAELNPYQFDMVSFYRIIDDKPVTTAEIEVQVGQGGQVVSVYYNLFDIQSTGEYPIRSAQETWDALLADDFSWEQMSFWTYATPPPPDPAYPVYQGWQPQYHPGETAELLGYPTVYQPAEGEAGPVRVALGELELLLSDADRQTLSGLTDRQLHVSGQVAQNERGGLVLQVSAWQESNAAPFSFTGTIQREGEGARFLRSDGVTFWLPHVPATLADGLQVSCYGWETGRQENGLTVMAWNYIQSPPMEEAKSEPGFGMDDSGGGSGDATVPGVEMVIASPAVTGSAGIETPAQAAPDRILPEELPMPPNFSPGNAAEAVEGQLYATVFENEDGSFTYSIQLGEMPLDGQGWYAELSGSQLEALAQFDRQWVRVWGRYSENEWPVIEVERFEAVEPSRTVQAWLGRVSTETIDGQTVNVLVTIPDQQRLVIASSVRWPDAYLYTPYETDRQTIFEGVLRSETLGGYPVIEDINWVNNEAIDQMSSAGEYTLPVRPEVIAYIPPPPLLPGKAYVDQVELAYSVTYSYDEATGAGLQFVQPVWRFTGHTDDGTRFVILMQAVDAEYIQP